MTLLDINEGAATAATAIDLPEVETTGVNIRLLTFLVARRSGGVIVSPPGGWTFRASGLFSDEVDDSRYHALDRHIPTGAGSPFSDTATSDDVANWDAIQLALRTAPGAPAVGASREDYACEDHPTNTATLPSPATSGQILVAAVFWNGCEGSTHTGESPWPGGWTRLTDGGGGSGEHSQRMDVAWKIASGGETGVTVTLQDDVAWWSEVVILAYDEAADCPIADFTGSPLSGQAPLTVAFTDQSIGGPTSWAWDFGDGGTSTEQNPTHEFEEAGVYTVTLVVSSSGCPDSEIIRANYVAATEDCRPLLFDVFAPGVGEEADQLDFIETLCSAADQWALIEELGTGSGGFRINRTMPEATAAVLGTGKADARLVKVRIPAVDAEPIFGWWLETGQLTLLDEQDEGAEDLVLNGKGVLAYLDRAEMAPRGYYEGPEAVAQPRDGLWRFERPDFSSSLGFLASQANGTAELVDEWQLPSINPAGDDVLLVAFLQLRENEDLTVPGGWTNRVQQDTSLGANELRYVMADRYHATGAGPYADTFESAAPVRWTSAQLAFRTTGAPAPETASAHQAASGQEDTISAALSGAPTVGNVLVAYVTETTDGPGVISYEFPPGWTILQRIPNKNTYTGYACVAYKLAAVTDTDVEATVRVTGEGTELTSTSLLAAEYPIVYQPLKAGEILYLVLAELIESLSPDRPFHLPLLSIDFTYELDSNGDPWDETPGTAQFTARVTDNVLDVVGRLLGTGALVIVPDVRGPGILVRAFNRSTYGRDLTGTDFGSGVVRLEAGVSIASKLTRDRVPSRAASHATVTGDGDVFAVVEHPDAATRVGREIGIRAEGTTEGAALEAIGADELARRDENAERLTVGLVVGNAPLVGRYLPGPDWADNGHVWPGDTVTADTGPGDFDYEDAPFRVAAVLIEEEKGDEAAVVEASDLDVSLRLGSNMEPDSLPSGDDSSFSTGVSSSTGGTGGGSTVDLSGYQLRSEKGLPDGYASIDSDGHVPVAELGTGAAGDGTNVLRDDNTWGPASGGPAIPFDHGDFGAAETIDIAANGTWHRGNLNVACAITVTGFTVDEGLVVIVELTGTGAITWDADVDFGGADDQPNASGFTIVVLVSSVGSADIKAGKFGGGATLTVQDEGSPLATAAAILDFVGAGVVATGTGAEKTITISGAPTGTAGGDLSGTYPNPSVVDDSHSHTSATVPSGGLGPLLLASDHSTPIVFDDILQASDGDDFLYASEP